MSEWLETVFAGIRVNARAGAQWPAGSLGGVCAGVLEDRLRELLSTDAYELRYRKSDLSLLRVARMDLAQALFQHYKLGDGTVRSERITSFKQLTEGEAGALLTFLDAP
ncbi:MAG: hypothetical protein GWN58_42375, partial [Anaerolineae bacterium]|nr:hypothetical protein [Anaerolineae bacterium]